MRFLPRALRRSRRSTKLRSSKAFPRPNLKFSNEPFSFLSTIQPQAKFLVLAALVAGASAFAPAIIKPASSTALFNEKADWNTAADLGWSMGGEDYTRDVQPHEDADPRKTIHEGPSFEEYMKQRAQQGQ